MGSVPAQPSPPFSVSSIAIIGAGPTGLACARYLAAQAAFERRHIVVFEQQAEVGGVWNYSARAAPVLAAVPQTDAHGGPEPPLPREEEGENGAAAVGGGGGGAPVFPSPMYERLHANIPAPLMQYSDRGFGAGGVIFPPRERIQSYLVEAAADLGDMIRLSTTVEDVRLVQAPAGAAPAPETRERWAVRSRNLATGAAATTEVFDAVVVANGHYSTPYVPDVAGLGEFARRHPTRVRHSKQYRTPEPYGGQKVLLVGNSASGLDLAAQIAPHCASPLYVSVRTATPAAQRAAANFAEVAEVARFLPATRGVELVDGTRLDGLDAVLFCTGYLYTFPFLEAQMAADVGGGGGSSSSTATTTKPPPSPPLVTDGRRVHGLYRHLVHIRHPTLAFAGLPVKVIPFPLAEAQAALLARVWANEIVLPPADAMAAWERDEAAARGDDDSFHVFPKGADGAYINALHDWVQGANNATEPARTGKTPPRWDAETLWMRAITPQAKLEFERTGRTATSLAALGFVYRPDDDEAAAVAVEHDRKKPPQPGLNVAG